MVVGWFVPKIRRLAFASSASTATASRWSSWDAFSGAKRASAWPRRQWSCWQANLQYLVSHRTHRGAVWDSGAAQLAQFVRIIFVWRWL